LLIKPLVHDKDRELRAEELAKPAAVALVLLGHDRRVIALAIESVRLSEDPGRAELGTDPTSLAVFFVNIDHVSISQHHRVQHLQPI
jgi:hypothetical protein